MDPAQLLRERERRLMVEYRACKAPRAFDADDLQCEDPATVEHWVRVYTELVDFVHSVLEPSSFAEGAPEPNRMLAIELQGKVLELHLAYWTELRNRLRRDPGPPSG